MMDPATLASDLAAAIDQVANVEIDQALGNAFEKVIQDDASEFGKAMVTLLAVAAHQLAVQAGPDCGNLGFNRVVYSMYFASLVNHYHKRLFHPAANELN